MDNTRNKKMRNVRLMIIFIVLTLTILLLVPNVKTSSFFYILRMAAVILDISLLIILCVIKALGK